MPPDPQPEPAPRFRIGQPFRFKDQPGPSDPPPRIVGSVILPCDVAGHRAGLHWLFDAPGRPPGRPLSAHDDDIEPIT